MQYSSSKEQLNSLQLKIEQNYDNPYITAPEKERPLVDVNNGLQLMCGFCRCRIKHYGNYQTGYSQTHSG